MSYVCTGNDRCSTIPILNRRSCSHVRVSVAARRRAAHPTCYMNCADKISCHLGQLHQLPLSSKHPMCTMLPPFAHGKHASQLTLLARGWHERSLRSCPPSLPPPPRQIAMTGVAGAYIATETRNLTEPGFGAGTTWTFPQVKYVPVKNDKPKQLGHVSGDPDATIPRLGCTQLGKDVGMKLVPAR